MAEKKSKIPPQSLYWHEDLPPSKSPLRFEEEGNKPDFGLDLYFVNNDIF